MCNQHNYSTYLILELILLFLQGKFFFVCKCCHIFFFFSYFALVNKLFPKQQIFNSSKLKEFADDNFRFDENCRKFSKRVPRLSASVVSVSGCEFDPWLSLTFFLVYFCLSPLLKHVRKVFCGFGKKSCVSTAVRKQGNTCALPTAMI